VFILGHLIIAIGTILRIAIDVYVILMVLRVILSWIPIDRNNQLVLIVFNLTNPSVRWLRKAVPMLAQTRSSLGFDFTPVIVLLVFYFINLFVVDSLLDIGQMLLH